MHKISVGLLFLIATLPCLAQTNDSIADALTRDLDVLASENLMVGFSVALYNKEGTLYERGFGYADKLTQKSYTKHTVQNIASISKTVSAIALLKAQELGKLDLDDPINKHLPFTVINPYYPDVPITIRQIATHTSSIQDRGYWYSFNSYVMKGKKQAGEKKKIYFSKPEKMLTLAELYHNYLNPDGKNYRKKSFSKHKPGEHYQYSNIASAIGAYIIELATGEDFKSFTQQHVFDPLGMDDTGWSWEDIDLDQHSKVYTVSHKPIAPYSLITYPDGGLRTSAHDMAIYGSELVKGYAGRGKLLSPKSYVEIYSGALTPEQLASRGNDNKGVFFEITDKHQIGHSGSDPGVTTLMYFDTDKRVGRYLQVNTEVNKKNRDTFRAIYNKLKEYETQF